MIKYRIIYTLIALSLALFYIYCDSYVPLLIIVVFLSLTVLSVISAAASARLVTVDTTASHSVVTKGEKTEAQFGIRLTNGGSAQRCAPKKQELSTLWFRQSTAHISGAESAMCIFATHSD